MDFSLCSAKAALAWLIGKPLYAAADAGHATPFNLMHSNASKSPAEPSGNKPDLVQVRWFLWWTETENAERGVFETVAETFLLNWRGGGME